MRSTSQYYLIDRRWDFLPAAILYVAGMEQRLFLGIPLDRATRQVLTQTHGIQTPGLRWIPPENLHLTLYFFGAVPIEMTDNLYALLDLALAEGEGFTLTFDRYVLAPKPRSPRMIWARYHKHEAFRALVQQLHALYQQIDPSIQMRKSPIPHVTLARLREWDGSGWPLGIPAPPPLPVKHVVLWQSTLTPKGAQYEVKKRWKFEIRNSGK